ncbi:MAG: xanthine dehydrogenase family protein subunit M [Rhodospirillaceae bacterium]|mgnify:FL=1|jgi:xanthine dehydrogenase YagS FAD-binding subunit|nr:xanthine dehydrogenase family protein subunit M [Rhodospirillaceae bacterium]MBT5938770.1 xanthine dehydrogenase family protein subunit M [Rhodospirillaceae bacterium]MBT7265767.1 xanthine dehydrogenase family protein subunit M [Rhodospirillaceae bacterium]
MLRDMMSTFELQQPTTVADALKSLKKAGKDGWVMAGGNDSLTWFKDRVKQPKTVIDITGISELKGIRENANGIEIGSLTSLTEIVNNKTIKAKFSLLSDSAAKVASPQIRNTGTLGGNVAQDTRCWYYRGGLQCYRAGGNTCFADTPTAMNREHTLFNASRCVAVSPSDIAPALVALDAKMVIQNSSGKKTIDAEKFFVGPAVDIRNMTILKSDEILTAIQIPNTWANSTFYFEKVADREVWDFPLVNIAAAMKVSGGVIKDMRVAVGGVEAVPKRLQVVEDLAKGEKKGVDVAKLAAKASVRGAKPLNFNHFKIPLMENLVTRAIRDS